MDSTFKAQSVAAQVAEAITEQVQRGSYRRGEALPPERVLANRFRVSRNTIREAKTRLLERGIVSESGHRLVVTLPVGPDEWSVVKALERPGPARERCIRDILRMRTLLWSRAVKRAVARPREEVKALSSAISVLSLFCGPGNHGWQLRDVHAEVALALASGAKDQVLAWHILQLERVLSNADDFWEAAARRRVVKLLAHDVVLAALETKDGIRARRGMIRFLRSVDQFWGYRPPPPEPDSA